MDNNKIKRKERKGRVDGMYHKQIYADTERGLGTHAGVLYLRLGTPEPVVWPLIFPGIST